jgi:arylsulfatase
MGYKRETTPNLDRLAEEGIVFKNAVSPAPRTIPSMPAIFTGKLLHFFNIDTFYGEVQNTRWHLKQNKTIAQKLSEKGYTTGAFCTNAYTSSYFGFNKGFDYFQDFLWSSSASHRKIFERMIGGSKLFRYIRNIRNAILKQEAFKSWESYYEDIIKWVKEAKEPFFLWIFSLDTHFPWIIARKYRKWGNFFNMYYSSWKIFSLLNKQGIHTSDKLRNRLINTYDDSIYYADHFIGKMAEDLNGYNPIFIIHSDHGEEFGERGFYGHSFPHLYEENIHVPLVIGNLGEKEEIEEPFSLTNLPKIILNLGTDDSFSIDNFLSGGNDWVISKDFDYENKKDVIAIRMNDWKFIRGQKDIDELYNLKQDPSEQENLIGEHPKLVEEMKGIIKSHFREMEKRRIHDKVSNLKM